MPRSLLGTYDEKQNGKTTENENKFHFKEWKNCLCSCGKAMIV